MAKRKLVTSYHVICTQNRMNSLPTVIRNRRLNWLQRCAVFLLNTVCSAVPTYTVADGRIHSIRSCHWERPRNDDSHRHGDGIYGDQFHERNWLVSSPIRQQPSLVATPEGNIREFLKHVLWPQMLCESHRGRRTYHQTAI